MHRAVREVAIAGFQEIGRFLDLLRGDLVGEVDDPGLGVDPADHPFYAGDEIVSLAEVGQQGDDGNRSRHGPPQSSSNLMSLISYSTTRAGVVTSTRSPTRRPISARPTGDWTEMRPFF